MSVKFFKFSLKIAAIAAVFSSFSAVVVACAAMTSEGKLTVQEEPQTSGNDGVEGDKKVTEATVVKQEKAPLSIVSEEMECDAQTNICKAFGNAKAVYEDDKGTKIIKALELVSYLKRKNKDQTAPQGEVESLEALGTKEKLVEIDLISPDSEKVHITCTKVIYTCDSKIATLEGPVVVYKGQNILTGDKGVVDFKNSTYNLSSGSSQTQALFYPVKK